MATGQSAQPGRGMVLSNVTPGADFRTGEAEAWDQGARLLSKYAEANKTNLIRRAQQRGAVEGAAVADGEPMPERGFLFQGDVAEARTAALQAAYSARVRTDFDAAEADVRQRNRYKPEAYEAEMGRVRSGFIQGAPPEFAVDVETYANSLSQRGLESVSAARIARDDQEVVQALSVRREKLSSTLTALGVKPGGRQSPEFLAARAEYDALQDQREGNPAILYSTDQRLADDAALDDGIMLAQIVAEAVKDYNDAGGGPAGVARASRYFQNEVLNGEEFADVDPGRLAKMHRDALAEFNRFTVADREERRVADEQERQRRAEQRAAADSAVLDASLGEIDEAEIMARDDLDDAGKSRALSAARSRQSRERTEASAARSSQALADATYYSEWRDDADAGTLNLGELGDAVNSGLISEGRAQTLRTINDRTLRPQVDDVMAPVRDAGERRRRLTRDYAQRMARAEEEVAAWVRNNPKVGIEGRLAAGRVYAELYFGAGANTAGGAGGDTAGGGADQARVARIRAVNEQIRARAQAGRPYSAAEANRMRAEAQGR